MVILVILLLLLGVLALGMVVRGWRFRPQEAPAPAARDIPIDGDRAVAHLQAMVRCKTVSQPALRQEAEFQRFRDLLPQCYPGVFQRCQVRRVDTTGVLLRYPGRTAGDPAVFLAHYDVVPAQEDAWEKPPFQGVLEDGVLWGRGALDMKNQLCGILEAMEYLCTQDFTPQSDIYLALSGEEEIMGPTARSIRDLFREDGITPAFVLDEGGDIMDGFFPGANVTCAMVGVGEKGSLNLDFVARSSGGHASTPSPRDPLPRLCRAMDRVLKHSFPQRTTPALEGLVDTMGRYCPLPQRVLLANRQLLRPLYLRYLRRTGGMIAAASRTTLALTQAQGSPAVNVLPTRASISANLRLLWGDTQESVLQQLRQWIRDPEVEIVVQSGDGPRPDSQCTQGWEALCGAIGATWPQAVVTPYLMVASTDSRHWRDICPNVYRFSAKAVTSQEKATVHGNNERIRVENTRKAAEFFVRLMETC